MHAGGCGKSTMAKLLYNRLQRAGGFSASAFVELQFGDGTDKTAQHLVAALEGLGARAKVSDGAAVLSQRLQSLVADKKLLYILDNVWTASQLTALLPTRWGEGSVVIVTSRSGSFPDSTIWPQVCALLRSVVHAHLHMHISMVHNTVESRSNPALVHAPSSRCQH
jgi:hypothetical protein